MIYVDVEKNTLNMESNAAINVAAKEEKTCFSDTISKKNSYYCML